MTGSPLFRAILVTVALLGLAFPLRRLTSGPPTPVPRPVAAPAVLPIRLELTSTKTPFHFLVTHLGRTVWEGDSAESAASRELSLPFPREGIELWIEAAWGNDGPAALKVELAREGKANVPRILWGSRTAGEVLLFH